MAKVLETTSRFRWLKLHCLIKWSQTPDPIVVFHKAGNSLCDGGNVGEKLLWGTLSPSCIDGDWGVLDLWFQSWKHAGCRSTFTSKKHFLSQNSCLMLPERNLHTIWRIVVWGWVLFWSKLQGAGMVWSSRFLPLKKHNIFKANKNGKGSHNLTAHFFNKDATPVLDCN